MNNKLMVSGVVVLLLVALALTVPARSESGKASTADKAMIERGRYLATIGGCGDCHTPKIMTPQGPIEDSTRLFSGHPADDKLPPVPANILGPDKWGAVCNNMFTAWVGPWGITYAPNLTSEARTGIGNWTEKQFIDALRTGKHRGFGRPILPPMPWQNIGKMTDDDLKALLAFFKSTPPIKNEVPAPLPPGGGK